MNMDQAELQEEKYYLQKVIHFADQRLDALQNRKLLLQKEIAAQTEVMREELTQIIRDFDDIMQLSMENAVLTDVQKQYAESDKEYHRIQNLKASPYFARIDFVDHEFGDENKIYIGTSGLSDSTSHQIYVCDWRAPVCELFYGFDTGEACYKTTAGKIDVTLLKKRQYKIVCGKIQGMYDSNASLYDEILGEALSGLTGPKLKVIVDSIQKEQNCAIRFIKNPHVLIFGPAGSGKTSVGMHRLAYMLYAQKDRLKAQDIVILSNNQIFSSYIAGILPQLCEEEVSRMVFHELLDSLLPLHIACEDFYSQYRAIEDMGFDGQECENRRERISLKYSVEMLKFIETYFKEYSFDLPDIQYKDDILISAQELNERIRRQLSDYSGKGMAATYHQRLELLLELVRKTYDNYFLDHQDQIRETIAAEVLDELGDEPEGTDLKLRYRWHRKQVIADTLETIRTRNQLNTYAHLLKILELYSKEKGLSEPMSVLVREDWDRGKLCFEDALLYVITGLFTGDIKPFSNVMHVLIDELQDYNPLQLYLVRLLYPLSAFTLLADNSQAVSSVMSVQQIDFLDEIWNMVSYKPLEKLPLTKSYRSSAPINAFAFRWLRLFDQSAANNYTYFQRNGKDPVILSTNDPKAAVWKLTANLTRYHLTAIITANEEDARELYQSTDPDRCQLITEPQEELRSGMVILPLILSKGLEFDAVILYRCMDRLHAKDSFARKMYLGCTRALHELYLIDTGQYL